MAGGLGRSPGQEGVFLRVKQQTQDFWNQQKQAYIDLRPISIPGSKSGLFDSKVGSGVNLTIMSIEQLEAESHS